MTFGRSPARHGKVVLGIALTVLATALFAALDTTGKVAVTSGGLPSLVALWGRYFFQAASTLAVVLPVRGRSALVTRHLPFQVLRGLLLLTSSFFVFLSIKYLPVGEFTAIMMLGPLLVTLLSAVLFGESVSPLRWVLVAGGFVGTLVIMRPWEDGFSPYMLLALAQVGFNTAFQLLTSRMARTEDPLTMHLYTGLIGATLASLALPVAWEAPASPAVWLMLVAMGLLGGAAHFVLILGYRYAPTSTLTPYLYAQIPFAMLAGWVAFQHVPDAWSVAGMALIMASGVAGAWLALHESCTLARALEAARPPQA